MGMSDMLRANGATFIDALADADAFELFEISNAFGEVLTFFENGSFHGAFMREPTVRIWKYVLSEESFHF